MSSNAGTFTERRELGALVVSVPITDEQAKAVQKLADFGTTVVEEGGQLARYVGRVLGTAPHDAVGIVLGDPLHFVRTAIAAKYDELLTRVLRSRNVSPQPVSPSLAIPLLRAAYDESRPELQELWAHLIASAMDPRRASSVRRSFIDTLQRFDPLDARMLRELFGIFPGDGGPNTRDYLTRVLSCSPNEVEVSFLNLETLRCAYRGHPGTPNFTITPYGIELVKACSTG
jgi:Abortive infection alpha